MFDAISTAGTGLQTYHTWLDVIADNIANVNDTAGPNGNVFRTHYVDVQSNGSGLNSDGAGDGVHIASIVQQKENGILTQDPTNPRADSQGYVRRADVDLSEQMGEMIMAQRAFQANASVVDRAKQAYEAALNIGKGV
jgi:flagellar basal-body rod protein FlgC